MIVTKHVDNRFSVTSYHVAEAVLKIAAVNHYLVGLDTEMADGISFDDYSDAHRILVDKELADHRNPKRAKLYERAFAVLARACFTAHRTHLGT